jgi:hypothetical protein
MPAEPVTPASSRRTRSVLHPSTPVVTANNGAQNDVCMFVRWPHFGETITNMLRLGRTASRVLEQRATPIAVWLRPRTRASPTFQRGLRSPSLRRPRPLRLPRPPTWFFFAPARPRHPVSSSDTLFREVRVFALPDRALAKHDAQWPERPMTRAGTATTPSSPTRPSLPITTPAPTPGMPSQVLAASRPRCRRDVSVI